ncbi:hypothetical protein H8S90_03715 [Olivibacter sp. SDN3]|uniref:hypothetical protein n=1 Tax=Olivibacter sp. SDN3 TaxID=2764720 RepID=UPI00165112FD|nr:hypothetical protein [Olivibacter sp. SDN3]QNL50717.1 hypothetical protein H8S90_03715 [Olivibacter sp. SDN3]
MTLTLCIFANLKILTAIIVLLFIGTTDLYAQEMEGIVFDTYTKQRVPRVYIYNMANDEMRYNNKRGEFSIKANPGDTLIAVVKGYHSDTTVVHSEKPVIIFNLSRATIWLDEVSIVARRSPQQILEERKRDYSSAYKEGNPGSLFSAGPTGAGLSIDALYSLLSRRGKNARFLQDMIQREYENNVIDARFTQAVVRQLTNLSGGALEDFMQQYRPTYHFIMQANDYELGKYIQSSYNMYRKNPGAYRLQPLPRKSPKTEKVEIERLKPN